MTELQDKTRDTCGEGARKAIWIAFYKDWDNAKESPNYCKKEWIEREATMSRSKP